MSLLKKLFKPRPPAAAPAAKARLVQLASAGPLLRGALHTTAAGYFGGELVGDLGADEEVWVEPAGQIRGNLRGAEFHIEGGVEGDLTASGEVTLQGPARVRGNISAGALAIARGAQFDGRLAIGGDETSLALNLRYKS
jgi:cytoskeletal protein CcmA (bactofilin family)